MRPLHSLPIYFALLFSVDTSMTSLTTPTKRLLQAITLLMLCLSPTLHANEASVQKALEKKLGTPLNGVQKGAMGFYEVQMGDGTLVYVDEKLRVLFAGEMIDLKNMRNLTEERMRVLSAVPFEDLPLSQALKIVRGNGKRVFASFEDPNCGYCKRLVKSLDEISDFTLYTFVVPALGLDSLKKSRQIWCSEDKLQAWHDWMVDGKAVSEKEDCEDVSVIEKNIALAKQLRVNGTPTLIFSDGERIPGLMPVNEIEKKLGKH